MPIRCFGVLLERRRRVKGDINSHSIKEIIPPLYEVNSLYEIDAEKTL